MALFLAYPHVRGSGGPWEHASAWLLRLAALAQVAAGVAWATRKSGERAYSLGSAGATLRAWWAAVTTPERVGLLYAIGGAWDLLGALAPWQAMVAAWGLTRSGNAWFSAAICVVQAHAIWKMWRAGR